MERIIIISDTHIPERAPRLPSSLLDTVCEYDLLVHAGDFTRAEVFDELAGFIPIKTVRGNMDEDILQRKLPERDIFQVSGVTVGVTHGWGVPTGIIQRVKSLFTEEQISVLIFGHTHQPLIRHFDSILYFNPGSPTDMVFAPYFSFGILEVDDGRINKAEIRRL